MEVARWAKERGCPWDEETCAYAAEGGHLEMLQWLRANGCSVGRVDLRLCRGGGHLEVLQWARANGAPWDEDTCTAAARTATWRCSSGRERTDVRGDEGLAAVAASGGHLEVLQWARANGCSVGQCDLRARRGWRPPGGAAVGASERRSVGRGDLRRCRARRPPGGAAVGASERRSVGRDDLRQCRGRRPPGVSAVGARERRSVGQ